MLPFFFAIAFRVFSRLFGIVAAGVEPKRGRGICDAEYNFVPLLSRNIVQALRAGKMTCAG